MYFLVKVFVIFSVVNHLKSIQIIWDNDAFFDTNELETLGYGKGGVVRMPNWYFIFPGKYINLHNVFDSILQRFVFVLGPFWKFFNEYL